MALRYDESAQLQEALLQVLCASIHGRLLTRVRVGVGAALLLDEEEHRQAAQATASS